MARGSTLPLVLLLGAALPAGAQGEPDFEISGTVRARELRFEVVPKTRVEFSGRPARKTVSRLEGLPKKIEPGVTYRNVTLRFQVSTTFEDVVAGGAQGLLKGLPR